MTLRVLAIAARKKLRRRSGHDEGTINMPVRHSARLAAKPRVNYAEKTAGKQPAPMTLELLLETQKQLKDEMLALDEKHKAMLNEYRAIWLEFGQPETPAKAEYQLLTLKQRAQPLEAKMLELNNIRRQKWLESIDLESLVSRRRAEAP